MIPDSFSTPQSHCWRHFLKAKQPLSIRQWTYAALAASASLTLQAASFVYIYRGGDVLPLWQPYNGLYAFVEAGPKFFTVDISRGENYIQVPLLPHQPPHHIVAIP
jgi:hypothetical protein